MMTILTLVLLIVGVISIALALLVKRINSRKIEGLVKGLDRTMVNIVLTILFPIAWDYFNNSNTKFSLWFLIYVFVVLILVSISDGATETQLKYIHNSK
ncbi:MAG: hypothetical protein LKJ14_02980 [Lactobacillus amylovorus]|jgi:uncharacterized membrane protein YhaH (DUF805 family)|nr:hypothetical protein [Lactobacillus amylovorus]